MAVKKENLPKGIMWREDKHMYLGRVTYQGKTRCLYDDNWKRLEIRLNALREQLEKGTYTEECKLTLNQWFDEWMEKYKKNTVKYGTYHNYSNHYNFYVRNGIGRKKLKDINVDDIQGIYNNLREMDFAQGTIKLLGATLNGCFKKAVNKRMINFNPVPYAEIPRCKEKKEKYVFTRNEQRQFLEYSKGSYLETFFSVVIMTGMRNGEARALRWCDIDFENKVINICHTMIWVEGEGHRLDMPKTKASKRKIPMLQQAYIVLYDMKERAEKMGIGNPENYVFCLPDGAELSRARVEIELEKIEKKMKMDNLEIGHFTCHTLRHVFATRAIESGMKPQVLKKILGHSSLQVTMDLYAHVLGEEKVEEMGLLEGAFEI